MHAVVIGGGIGGATAALALAEIGVEVEVHEAGVRSAEDWGWVTLGPAAMTGLDQVGVADGLRAVGFPITKFRTVDVVTGGCRSLLILNPRIGTRVRTCGGRICYPFCGISWKSWA